MCRSHWWLNIICRYGIKCRDSIRYRCVFYSWLLHMSYSWYDARWLNVCCRCAFSAWWLHGIYRDNSWNKASSLKVSNVITGRAKGSMREVCIRVQDFQDFLLKSDSINWLILYKTNFSFFLYAIISTSIYNRGFFSNNVSYSYLAMIYHCYFYTHTLYFSR